MRVWRIIGLITLVTGAYAFQRPFREYPGLEYNNFPLPADAGEKTEWVFGRLMYPPHPESMRPFKARIMHPAGAARMQRRSICVSVRRICFSAQPSCWRVVRWPGAPEHGSGVNVSWITTGLSRTVLAAGLSPPACVAAKPVARAVAHSRKARSS